MNPASLSSPCSCRLRYAPQPAKIRRHACPLAACLCVLCALLLPRLAAGQQIGGPRSEGGQPFDGQQAYEHLQQICKLGPRTSGSPGMQAQQQMVREHFAALGGKVGFQEFRIRHPVTGRRVTLANCIVQWHPEKKKRILLCAHYDTRPYPDQDPNPRLRRSGTFLGANDGASGVALLMELGRAMPQLESEYGIDFVLFDGEEFVFRPGDRYFLGSDWFARQYVADPPQHRYVCGILLDMVGDADLQIFQEKHSVSWRDTKPLVDDLWATAARLGIEEFVPRVKHEVNDDHLPLRNTAKIPTCNIIDFDYPHWHTTADTPDKCSAASLEKVGRVLLYWLQHAR